MKIIVNGVPAKGAKSRVETQIRMRLELVAPASPDDSGVTQYERIGSFTHIKVPPLSGTKRKSKKHQKFNVPMESMLLMEANVVNATPPHARIFVCNSCRERERKRAHRKKSKNTSAIIHPTEDEMRALDIDPSMPNAMELAASRIEEEERKHAVLFNCGDYIDFQDGEAVLSTRITCYCRHHREKVGFHIVFTLRNYLGDFIASGSTPPIMIMDDHKSLSQGLLANRLADPRGMRSNEASGSTAPPPASELTVLGRARDRAKPYDDTTRRRARSNAELPTGLRLASPPTVTPAPSHELSHMSFMMDQNRATPTWLGMPPVPDVPPEASPGMLNARSSMPVQDTSLALSETQASDALLPSARPTDALLRSHQAVLNEHLANVDAAPSLVTGEDRQGVNTSPLPHITKLIPAEGPTTGGIEITVLGENFVDGVQCVFGDTPSTMTRVWASSTLVCLLPPSFRPGPVIVSLQGASPTALTAPSESQPLQLFTYIDTTDRALMELALQVVGLQMTGHMASARDIAMRIVSASQSRGADSSSHGAESLGHTMSAQDVLSSGLRLYGAAAGFSKPSVQDSLLGFLTLLDVPMDEQHGIAGRRDALHLCNQCGHTLLHLAVVHNFCRLIADLLRRGCPVNARDVNGYTALHFAALHGWTQAAKLLLQYGADPVSVNEEGCTPLDVARRSDKADCEQLLEDVVGESLEADYGDETSDEEDADEASDSEDEDAWVSWSDLVDMAQLQRAADDTPKRSSWGSGNAASQRRFMDRQRPTLPGPLVAPEDVKKLQQDSRVSTPMHSPPPTYDEATNKEMQFRHIGGEKLITEASQFAALQAEGASDAMAAAVARNARFNRGVRARRSTRDRSKDTHKETIVRPRQGVYDDHMLLWFWIPAMLIVLVASLVLQSGSAFLSFPHEGFSFVRALTW